MDVELKIAYLIADAMTKDCSLSELARLHIVLQTVSSLIASELSCRRNLGSTTAESGAGK